MDKLFPIAVNSSRSRLEESKETPEVLRSDGRSTPSSRSTTNNESTSRRYNPDSQVVRTQRNRNTSRNAQDKKEQFRRNNSEDEASRNCSSSIIRRENFESSCPDLAEIHDNSSFTI